MEKDFNRAAHELRDSFVTANPEVFNSPESSAQAFLDAFANGVKYGTGITLKEAKTIVEQMNRQASMVSILTADEAELITREKP